MTFSAFAADPCYKAEGNTFTISMYTEQDVLLQAILIKDKDKPSALELRRATEHDTFTKSIVSVPPLPSGMF